MQRGYLQSSITSDDSKNKFNREVKEGEKRQDGIHTNKIRAIFSFSIRTHAVNAYISSVNTISAV